MLSRLIRKCLFLLLHLAVNVLVAIHNVYHRLCIKMCNSPQYDSIITEVVSVREHVSSITKELRHLVVLVDTDQHSLNELARMIIWSLVFGISHISFYDITGELQKKEDKLFFEVEKQKKGIPGCIKWSKMPNLNGYTNGIHANTIFVNILSYNDGRPKLTKCIQEISRNTMLCERSLDEYTSQELDWTFKSKYPLIPDPNLVLYTGPLCCTYGLLPWHIRLTEFIQISIDHSINVNNYLSALYKYNKCDFRFGK